MPPDGGSGARAVRGPVSPWLSRALAEAARWSADALLCLLCSSIRGGLPGSGRAPDRDAAAPPRLPGPRTPARVRPWPACAPDSAQGAVRHCRLLDADSGAAASVAYTTEAQGRRGWATEAQSHGHDGSLTQDRWDTSLFYGRGLAAAAQSRAVSRLALSGAAAPVEHGAADTGRLWQDGGNVYARGWDKVKGTDLSQVCENESVALPVVTWWCMGDTASVKG